MIYALTESAARRAEERAVAEVGLILEDLMRRAGAAVAREIETRVPYGAIAILAGMGNNGGDGWVAARELAARNRPTRVFTRMAPEALEGLPAIMAAEATAGGVAVSVVGDEEMEADALVGYAVIVDAMFGIGLTGSPRQPYASWIDATNASGASVIAVDIPSGVEADSGRADAHCVQADITVTFSSPKVGLLVHPGAEHAGDVRVADIGIPWELLGEAGDLELWGMDDYRSLMPCPQTDTHKNELGRVLIVAGSGAFPGAAALAAMGAQRMGAGYVTLAVPESVAHIMQTKLSSAVVVGLPENPSRTLASRVTEEVLDMAKEYDAVVLGPGLTVAHGAVLVARNLVNELQLPLVVDADGLNALVYATDALTARSSPTVITPHPGEAARLLGMTPAQVQWDRLGAGARLTGSRCACVLKGARTIVSGAGRQIVTMAGGPALATAGTGDVLAGMIGALLAQGLEPLEAGALGAYLHGRAGDHAANILGAPCVIAEDVPAYLPLAVKELVGEE
ncbi:MAG: NAD(P)H-hydrate dehydratase [Actinomycetota bacterium]|nr:NAD(P)H-hydrate dehydratase [Actinomycetota bacterium]